MKSFSFIGNDKVYFIIEAGDVKRELRFITRNYCESNFLIFFLMLYINIMEI